MTSQTLLREAGAGGRTLAGLELGVRFADHVNRALAFHNLAIGMTTLGGGEGRENFHGGKWCVLDPAGALTGGAKASQPTHLVKAFLARICIFHSLHFLQKHADPFLGLDASLPGMRQDER